MNYFELALDDGVGVAKTVIVGTGVG